MPIQEPTKAPPSVRAHLSGRLRLVREELYGEHGIPMLAEALGLPVHEGEELPGVENILSTYCWHDGAWDLVVTPQEAPAPG